MFDDNYVKSLVSFLYFLKQPPKLFCKKGFLKDFTIMTVKRLFGSLFNRVVGLKDNTSVLLGILRNF